MQDQDPARTQPAGRERTHRATDVRQGEIVLRRRWQRLVFAAGLVGIGALGLVVAVVGL